MFNYEMTTTEWWVLIATVAGISFCFGFLLCKKLSDDAVRSAADLVQFFRQQRDELVEGIESVENAPAGNEAHELFNFAFDTGYESGKRVALDGESALREYTALMEAKAIAFIEYTKNGDIT